MSRSVRESAVEWPHLQGAEHLGQPLVGAGHSIGAADTIVSDYTALLSGSWNITFGNPVFVTYSFDTTEASYPSGDGLYQSFLDSFQPFTTSEQANARNALNQWAQASGITFLEAPAGEGDIRFGKYDFDLQPDVSDAAGFSYIPYFDLNAAGYADDPIWGDVFINTTNAPAGSDDATLFYLLHEIGHAIGMKHPFDDEPILDKSLDNTTHTVMSYTGGIVAMLGDLDLQAVAYVYGGNNLDGTETPGWHWSESAHTLFQTGGGGDDLIRGVSAEDVIDGGSGNNIIYSGAGNDTLNQSAGHDTIFGGAGNDVLNQSGGTDIFDAGAGDDTLTVSGGSGTLHGGVGNDHLISTETGTGFVQMFGDQGNDELRTMASSGTLNGGYGGDILIAGDGSATLIGDDGNDSLTVGNGAATLDGGPGYDTIRGGEGIVSIAGGDNSDVIVVGSATTIDGGEGDDSITASSAGALEGGSGNDVIRITAASMIDGGAGNDTIYLTLSASPSGTISHVDGGDGSDAIYLTGSPQNALISDHDLYGSDSVYSAQSIDLSASQGISFIALTGSAPTSAIGTNDANTIIGTSGANLLSGLGGNDVFLATGGHDTFMGGAGLDYASYARASHGISADLTHGVGGPADGQGNVYDSVEGLIGTYFDDLLIGNDDGNAFTGGGGDDTIYGGGGSDTISYYGSSSSVTVNLQTGATGGGAAGDVFYSIESVTGSGYSDTLTGTSGDDTLNSGGGHDTLNGWLGNDTYIASGSNSFGDPIVVETAGGGTDTVIVQNGFVLGAGASVEVLRAGPAMADYYQIVGNELAQRLEGNGAINILDGGQGVDTLVGAGGNDHYIVQDAHDVVIENVGQGNDAVDAYVSYALGAGQSIESLAAFFPGEDANSPAFQLVGNEFDQHINGGAAGDTLNGAGGADTLKGWIGSDRYIVDNAGDRVIEAAGEGTDTVFASTSYALQAGQSVEVLATTLLAGAGALNLTGNEFAQAINGNSGSNLLNGGAGADTLSGFGGNDVFVVDNIGDKVLEAVGQGTDTVYSAISYVLSGGQSVDVLTTNAIAGVTAINLTGNEQAQIINGNNGINGLVGGGGSDTLNGYGGNDRLGGGAGHDVLDGGTGNDTLVYSGFSESTSVNRDLVLNMVLTSADKFQFTVKPTAVNTEVTHGALNGGSFDDDLAAAADARHFGAHHAILFDPDSGDLNVAGHVFLVVDANGQAGYQAGQDYVVELAGVTGALTVDDFT